jgi:hypothetical protein
MEHKIACCGRQIDPFKFFASGDQESAPATEARRYFKDPLGRKIFVNRE